MPGRAVGAQVTEESRVQQRRRARAVPYLPRLPRVQRQGGVPVGQWQSRTGEPSREPFGG